MQHKIYVTYVARIPTGIPVGRFCEFVAWGSHLIPCKAKPCKQQTTLKQSSGKKGGGGDSLFKKNSRSFV